METNIQTLENCKTVVTLKAGKEEWAGKIEKAYNKLETKVSLPGFRKGKAPKEMVRSKIKLEDVFNEALNYFLNDNYSKVLKDNNLRPIVQPTIDVKKISLEEVECDITVVGEPKVELKEYKGITVEKSPVAVTESEINEELTRLQERNAEVYQKEQYNKKQSIDEKNKLQEFTPEGKESATSGNNYMQGVSGTGKRSKWRYRYY